MSGAGNCYDNAVVESFFHTLKTEHVYQHSYNTREEAKRSLFECVEIFYNRQRAHSFLGYLSSEEFEKNWKKAVRVLALRKKVCNITFKMEIIEPVR